MGQRLLNFWEGVFLDFRWWGAFFLVWSAWEVFNFDFGLGRDLYLWLVEVVSDLFDLFS